jgi:hypothetical protein
VNVTGWSYGTGFALDVIVVVVGICDTFSVIVPVLGAFFASPR